MTSWIDNISDIRPDYVEERQCNRRKTEVTRENYNAPPSERGRLDYNRLSAYDGRPRHRRLPYRLFLAAPVAKCCSVADVRGGGFFGSRLRQLPPRLLQCLAVRHCRRPTSVSPERSCAFGDWNPAHRPHYAGSPVTSLAAGATTRHFQVGDTGSQVLGPPSTWLYYYHIKVITNLSDTVLLTE